MNQPKGPYHFRHLRRKYQLIRGTEVLLWSTTVGVLVFFLVGLAVLPPFVNIVAASMCFMLTVIVCSHQVNLFGIRENDLATYLNKQYPALQDSVDLLLLNDDELSSLQRLQKKRTIQQFEKIYPIIKLPHHIGHAAGMLALSLLVGIVVTAFSKKVKQVTPAAESHHPNEDRQTLSPASISHTSITIIPPRYTGLDKHSSPDFDLRIPEGSIVEWRISFDNSVVAPRIVLSTKDSISLTEDQNGFTAKHSFSAPGFYHLQWTSNDSVSKSTDYYKIDIIEDHAPTIAIENLRQFLELDATDNPNISLQATLTDDYGLKQADIIATVSKGTGEAIKFREEKLMFDSPKKIEGKTVRTSRSINLASLGLQPGDELYFYVEVTDIKAPTPNRARTETYFISLKDTTSQNTVMDASLGADLMPEYFRSQRQIIIDTEKLLKERKRISKQEFNDRSNALAYDQKLLRLRYGEFLGEEFESSIGPKESVDDQAQHDESVEKKFGHIHDKDNGQPSMEEKNTSHDEHGAIQGQKEDPAKPYVHAHDSEEEATFFTQSIRAKLKAAITIMWDAELHLRLYHPNMSLPHQYKALRLLKEISQDSRVYVHRTGFDAPPLKEEKRLTGDLAEIKNSTAAVQYRNQTSYPRIRAALVEIEKILNNDIIDMTPSTATLLVQAGQELAAVEDNRPGRYLQALSLLKRVTQHEIRKDEIRDALVTIRSSFAQTLPAETTSPQTRDGIHHALDVEFLKKLEASRPLK